jgi:endonuclease YncB( thermonuclease family)
VFDKITWFRHRWRARTMLGRPLWRISLRRAAGRSDPHGRSWRPRGRWRRIASRPRVAMVVMFAAAMIGWFQPDLRAGGVLEWLRNPVSAVASARHMVLRPGAAGEDTRLAVLPPQPAAGSGAFRLCSRPPRYNCVVDGDTIWHGGVKIRLAGIDTPEVFSPKCASEAALGRQATERLLELINAGPFEVVRSGSRDADRYGRKLRILERHGRSLGAILIAEGLARPWDGARRSWCG